MLITEVIRTEVEAILLRATNDINSITGRRVTVECKEWQDGSLKALNEKDAMLRQFVCEVCEIDWEQLTLKTRKRDIVLARQLYCWFAYSWVKINYKAIGEIVGGRDHTTAIHSCQTVKDLLDIKDPKMTHYHQRITVKINASSL